MHVLKSHIWYELNSLNTYGRIWCNDKMQSALHPLISSITTKKDKKRCKFLRLRRLALSAQRKEKKKASNIEWQNTCIVQNSASSLQHFSHFFCTCQDKITIGTDSSGNTMAENQNYNAVTFDNCTSWSRICEMPSSILISCNTRIRKEINLAP